ncbi:MAG: metal-dependent hydrolase, partial [Candidatus Nanoarchaeia archaeon]
MLARTHLAFGFLTALLIKPLISTGNTFIFIPCVLFGALLPDIDKPNSKISSKIPAVSRIINIFSRHRGIFHSLLFAIFLPGIVWYFISHTYGIAILVGYLSHLVIDGFTKEGINFLHPFARLHLSGFVETGTATET